MIQREQLHAGRCEHFLPRRLRVARRFLHRGPAEDRHELTLGRAVLGGNGSTRLAQAVRRAMREARFIAAFAEPVAEAVRGEGLAELGDEEGEVANLCRRKLGCQLGQQRDRERHRLALAVLYLREGDPAVLNMLRAERDNIRTALAGVEQQSKRKPRLAARLVPLLELADLFEGPAMEAF